MKKYLSHKPVEAGKIAHVSYDGNLAKLTFEDGDEIELAEMTMARIMRMAVESPGQGSLVGGYLVRYGDGYLSWSPGEQFEDGYREVPE